MKISVGYILAFIGGILLLLLINFIANQRNSSVKSNSGLYPMVYKSIEDQQSLLNNISTSTLTIENYKKQIQYAQESLNNIKHPTHGIIINDSPALLINVAKNFREQLQIAFEPTIFNFYERDYDKLYIETTLAEIATDIANNFSWTYDLLWSNNIYADPDSLKRTPGGAAFLKNLAVFLQDSIQLKNKKDQMQSVLKSKIEQVDQQIIRVRTDKENIENQIKGLNASLNDIEQSSKDRMLMYVVIPLFGLIVVLLMVLPYIYKNNADILAKLFEQKIILQIFTVFILVMAILLLGIGDKINAETLGTLLGGISVYVLQKTMDGTGQTSNN